MECSSDEYNVDVKRKYLSPQFKCKIIISCAKKKTDERVLYRMCDRYSKIFLLYGREHKTITSQ